MAKRKDPIADAKDYTADCEEFLQKATKAAKRNETLQHMIDYEIKVTLQELAEGKTGTAAEDLERLKEMQGAVTETGRELSRQLAQAEELKKDAEAMEKRTTEAMETIGKTDTPIYKNEMAEDLAALLAYYMAQGIEPEIMSNGGKEGQKIIEALPEAKKIIAEKIDLQAIRRRLRRAPYKGMTFNDLATTPGGKSFRKWKEAKTDIERGAIKYQAFYEDDEITLFERLIFGSNYRTRTKAKEKYNKSSTDIVLAEKQDYLSIPTLKPYVNVLRPGRGNAGGREGVQYIKRILDKSSVMQGQQLELSDFTDIEAMRLPGWKDKTGKDHKGEVSYNIGLLHYILTCFRKTADEKGRPHQYVAVRRSDLVGGNMDGKTLEENLKRYQCAFQKADDGNYYAILLVSGYNPKDDAYIFSSPYMSQLLGDIKKAQIVKDKNGKPKKTRTGSTKKLIAFVEDIAAGDLKNERDEEAIADVIEIVRIIAMTGAGTPHITAGELMRRNEIFLQRYEATSNKRQLLKRHYANVWRYLEKHAGEQLRKKYDGIRLPGKNPGPEWYPTPATLDRFLLEFPHNTKTRIK